MKRCEYCGKLRMTTHMWFDQCEGRPVRICESCAELFEDYAFDCGTGEHDGFPDGDKIEPYIDGTNNYEM